MTFINERNPQKSANFANENEFILAQAVNIKNQLGGLVMKMDFKVIVNDSNQIYELLSHNIKYLYEELQELTRMGDTQLCLAICQLLHDGRICRRMEDNLVYYLKRV